MVVCSLARNPVVLSPHNLEGILVFVIRRGS